MNKFYQFSQNNSGGKFIIDPIRGIGSIVIIEAINKQDAINKALKIGIYFEGVDQGLDCACCGDRWFRPFELTDLEDTSGLEGYFHDLNGKIYQSKDIKNAVIYNNLLNV